MFVLELDIFFWVILTQVLEHIVLPLGYFGYLRMTYFYQFLRYVLTTHMHNHPLTVSIFVAALLSLSRPVGELTFVIAFWNMSRVVSYERKMKLSMVIAGWRIRT